MNLRVGDLSLDDLPSLAALDQRLFTHPWPLEHLRRALESDQPALGCWVDERLVGYLIGQVVMDEAELLQIGVAPELRRHGCASLLLQSFLAQLQQRQVVALHLEVRVSALPAQAFYRRSGFQAVGRRRGYYPIEGGREDALLYRLEL